jgi:transglutaminase-like putative cysteine protease
MAAVTGAAFGRLFLASSSGWKLAVAGAAAVAVSSLLGRRSLPLLLIGAAAGLVVTIGVLIFPATTVAGLPTAATLRATARALSSVGGDAAREFTPAIPLPSLITASIIAVWSAGTAAHALAHRAASPVLALLPPGGLLVFASSLAADGVRYGYAAGFLGAALLLLLAAGRREVVRWGPVIPRSRRLLTGRGGVGGLGLGSVAVATALLVPGALPGLRSGPLIELDARTAARKLGVSPIVDIRPALLSDPAVKMFRVRADRPAYWRLLSLERFDGRFWRSGDPKGLNAEAVGSGVSELPGTGPGLGVTFPSTGSRAPDAPAELVQDFELLGLDTDFLPAAYQPFSVELTTATAFDPARSSLAPIDDPPEQYRYRVRSLLRVPTPDELKAVSAPDMERPLTEGAQSSLPESIPPRIHRLVDRLTRSEPTPYEKVLAIQNYLRSFAYDLRAPAGHGASDLIYFLERSKRGYCEQFAGAMAVLVRTLGYGSRVAVGFLPGERASDGRFVVSTHDAHAWPEIFFPGHGWLAFEPTPTRANPVATDYVAPAAAIIGTGTTQGETALTQGRQGQAQREASERARQEAREAEARRRAAAQRGGLGLRLALLSTAALAAILVALTRRRLSRRWRLLRARTPADTVLAAYRVFEAQAEDVGLARRPSETPHEYAGRLGATVTLSGPHLERLTASLTAAAYASRDPGPEEVSRALLARHHLARDVRRHVGRLRALAGAAGFRRS